MSDKVFNLNIKPNTIFVSIASFRDDECNLTIKRLYEKAKYPNNIFVGLCQQNNYQLNDADSLYNIHNNTNIRVIRIPFYEAKGPTYARFLCSSLYNGEEFYFQTDSHMKFVQDWDELCINMIRDIKKLGISKKPVLSHYPKPYEEYDNPNNNPNSSWIINTVRIEESSGLFHVAGSAVVCLNKTYNKNPYIGCQMMFSEAYFLNEIPYNPRMDYLFVGEETLHAIKLYTFGWDIFSPICDIVYHEYARDKKPKMWTDIKYDDKYAQKRVKRLLKLIDDDLSQDDNYKHDLKYYGLGNVRTLEEYYDFAGIDIVNKNITKLFGEHFITKQEVQDDEESMIYLLKNLMNKLDDDKTTKKDKSINLLLKLLDNDNNDD